MSDVSQPVEATTSDARRDDERYAVAAAARRRQNVYLYDQWGLRIVTCDNTRPHKWHGWVAGNEDLRCPGVLGEAR